MTRLITLSRAEGTNGETDSGKDITISPMNILMIEDSHEREPGHSKIILTTGKMVYVEESQVDIVAMANEKGGLL